MALNRRLGDGLKGIMIANSKREYDLKTKIIMVGICLRPRAGVFSLT